MSSFRSPTAPAESSPSPPQVQRSYRRRSDQLHQQPPAVPPASLKPKLLKPTIEEEEGDSASLVEAHLRKAINKFGTMPKGQRIEAFLDSIERNSAHVEPYSDDLCHPGSSSSLEAADFDDVSSASQLRLALAQKELQHAVSDDSLDTIPLPSAPTSNSARAAHEKDEVVCGDYKRNELLAQLKQRLKKPEIRPGDSTISASPASIRKISVHGSAENIAVIKNTPAAMIGKRPEPKPRRSDNEAQTTEQDWKKNLHRSNSNGKSPEFTPTESSEQETSGESELQARIRQLRHVQTTSSSSTESDEAAAAPEERRVSLTSNNGESDELSGGKNGVVTLRPVVKNGLEKPPRQVVTQKVAPLQHHRPFSMQNSSAERSPPMSHKSQASIEESCPTISMQTLEKQRQESIQPRPYSTLQRQIQRQKTDDLTLNSEAAATKPRKFPPTLSSIPSRPSPPTSSSPGSGEDEESAMARAHSLKDLTSKFENLGRPGPTATHRTVSEKRFSCFEPNETDMSEAPHHSTPTNLEDGLAPAVSKDQLGKLYRQLETSITDLRNKRKPVLLRTPIIAQAAAAGPNSIGSNDKSIIKLSDNMQRFHDICKIYAENISPHSKFRYR